MCFSKYIYGVFHSYTKAYTHMKWKVIAVPAYYNMLVTYLCTKTSTIYMQHFYQDQTFVPEESQERLPMSVVEESCSTKDKS